MDSQPTPNNGIPSATANTQDGLFNDIVDTAPYEKSLKTARIYLYIIATIQFGIGVYEYLSTEDKELALIAGAVDAGIGVLFLLFALWSYKKPAIAFMTALIAFLVIHIGLAFLDSTHIYKGIILKVLVIVALIKGFNDARQVEKLRESVGATD